MTSPISTLLAAAAPQSSPLPPVPSPDNAFAKMLSQRQSMAHEAAPPRASETARPTPADKPRAASQHPVTPQSRPASTPPAAAPRNAERTSAPADKAASANSAEVSKDAEPEATEADDKDLAAEADTLDPTLAGWMAALHLPQAVSPEAPAQGSLQGGPPMGEAAVATPDADVEAADDKASIDGSQPTRRGRSAPGADDKLVAGRDVREKADSRAELSGERMTATPEWQAAVEHVRAAGEMPLRHETPGVAALGATAHTAGAGRAAATQAPVVVSVPTPATSPEFAQSLGVQVSVLAREGVQKAELHLNPAEMGPISIQIALEGSQAQVNFGADSAATRQIIESGLPELAAALRDAGFTLSGGGVHSQARGRGDNGEASGGPDAAPDGAAVEGPAAPRRAVSRVAAGGVDLYA